MNTLNVMVGNAMMYAGAAGGGGASIGKFIQSMGTNIGSWVKMIVMIIGVIMVGAGIYQIAKNLISHGKGQTNWIVTFSLIIIGAILMLSGGWSFIKDFSKAGENTLDKAAKGNAEDAGVGLGGFETIIFDH